MEQNAEQAARQTTRPGTERTVKPDAKRAARQEEKRQQIQLIQWARADPRLQYLYHVPNEAVGGAGWRARNRQMGVKAGVPDLCYPVPRRGYHGMYIEMKAGKGRLSAAQAAWVKALKEMGYHVVVAHGWEEARDAILAYLS